MAGERFLRKDLLDLAKALDRQVTRGAIYSKSSPVVFNELILHLVMPNESLYMLEPDAQIWFILLVRECRHDILTNISYL